MYYKSDLKLRTKRSSNSLSDPIELPRKRRSVSQQDNDNIELLAEAGQQPCQEQWVSLSGIVVGLGTHRQFESSETLSGHKILQPCSLPKLGWMK